MGFVIAGSMVLYLLLSIGVVVWAIRFAKKSGKSVWRWGGGSLLVMYLIPFWDWLPTVAAHQYYCAKDSGFWVYETLDQWKAKNPGVMQTLVANKVSIKRIGNDEDHVDTQILNQRFNLITEKHRLAALLPLYGWRSEIVDSKDGTVIARYVNFAAGKGYDHFKVWMNISYCEDGSSNRSALYSFADALIKMTDLKNRNSQ
jgi:hypothetical protein